MPCGPLFSTALRASILSATLALAAPTLATAQDLFAVLVKVNDVVISGFDVQQRATLLALGAPGQDPARFEARALDLLIADELKLQEAERQGVRLSDADLADAVRDVASRNNGKTTEQLIAELAAGGVSRETFERQLRADLVWNELLRRRYGDRVTPTESEIDAEIGEQTASGELRYDLQQIVVPLSPDAPDDNVRRAFDEAVRVRGELTDCSRVRELAPRYSRISGVVGRMTAGQMPGPIRDAVLPLDVGQTTNPMRSADGVHVIILCNKISPQAASRSQVFNRLLQEKAGRFSQSYLDDLRRNAMIESRQ